MNNDYILEDRSDFFYLMAQMLMPTIQMSSLVDVLTCSGEVQPSTASFIASQQLQTEANIHPQAPQAQNAWCMLQLVYIENCMGKSPIVKKIVLITISFEIKFSYLKCIANLSFVPILKPF